MKLSVLKHIVVLSFIGLFASACGMVTIERVNPTQVVPTQKPIVIVVTATPKPPTPTSSPTLPIISTAIPPMGSIRLTFAQGATSGTAQGYLHANQTQNFIVGAMQGQPMIVQVDSKNQDVTLAISSLRSGQILLPASLKHTSWQGLLPSSQDYSIQVSSGANPDNFYLNVIIPSRIKLSPGAISATVSGSTPGGLNVEYALNAMTGQTMQVILNVPTNSAALTIYGYQDGQPMVRAQMNQTTFSTKLPATQDYIIEVVPYAGTVVNYAMTVTVK